MQRTSLSLNARTARPAGRLLLSRHQARDPAASRRNRARRDLIVEGDRTSELPLAVLAILLRNGDDALEQGQQFLLGRRDDGVGDLGLTPEDLPVFLLRRLHAVEL